MPRSTGPSLPALRWALLSCGGHAIAAGLAMMTLARSAERVPPPPPPAPVLPVAVIAMADGGPMPARADQAPDPSAVELPEAAPLLPTMSVPEPAIALTPVPAPVPVAPAMGAGAGTSADLFTLVARPRRPGTTAASSPSATAAATGEGWEAAVLERDPPDYPRSARRAGHEGSVTLHLELAADGTVAAVRVLASSGFADLDRAACAAARRWRFAPPASRGLARAEVRQTVTFRLRTAG